MPKQKTTATTAKATREGPAGPFLSATDREYITTRPGTTKWISSKNTKKESQKKRRFRIKRIAWIADIEKAFLNIALPEEESNAVCYLWS